MFILTAFLIFGASISSAQHVCFDDVSDPYVLMASKTAYEFVYEHLQSENHPSCTPKQFWILARHGTRYPGKNTLQEIIEDGPKLQADILKRPNVELCAADIANLRDWNVTFSIDQANELTQQGYLDLYNIARRFQQRFPSLLDVPYNRTLFEFRTGVSQRTIDSTEAFAQGLFGSATRVYVPQPTDPDPLIETYSACPAWKENVEGNPESLTEMNDFIASQYVTDVINAISKRLGFDSSNLLTYANISLIYDICRFEKAWSPSKLSPWCAAFTTDELQVLEYIEDLKYHYTESYGNDLTVQVGCPPVKDFVQRFSSLASGADTEPQGIFYFSHSTMINMVISRLGLYKDPIPPTSANYESMRDRKWRSSKIGSFASNVAAAFYECDSGERYRFQLFIAEKAVELDGCPTDNGLSSWTCVKESLADIVSDCDMSICNGSSAGNTVMDRTFQFKEIGILLGLSIWIGIGCHY